MKIIKSDQCLLSNSFLSDNNYFKVFWGDKFTAKYYNSEEEIKEKSILKIRGRDFLGH